MVSNIFRHPVEYLFLMCFLASVPISILITLELRAAGSAFFYHSGGWMRESAKWDDIDRRFLVSYMDGGVAEIPLPDDDDAAADGRPLAAIAAVKDSDLAGNASLGIAIDRPRNRIVVAVADVLGNRYSGLAAYDLGSWQRVFLTHLSTPGGEKTFADDVAVDADGNAYVTDAKGNKIWKVSSEGALLSTITSPLFQPRKWYESLIGLNGILYHPDGYLLVVHTMNGNLYKIDRLGEQGNEAVRLVEGVKLWFGDGMELVSGTRLVVAASYPSARLVESTDGWETAKVVGRYVGPVHRLATAATVKDGKVYLSHMFGFWVPKTKHMLAEAVFS